MTKSKPVEHPMPGQEPEAPLLIPLDREIDCGIITSGMCATPEAQAWFDEHQVGKPPLDATEE